MKFIFIRNFYAHLICLTLLSFLISHQANAQIGSVGTETIGLFQTQQIVGNVGIGSTAPGEALDVQGTVRATSFTGQNGSGLLGAWNSISINTVYQATTDTFVTGSVNFSGPGTLSFITDSSSSPTTVREYSGANSYNNAGVVGFARKGDYYEIQPNTSYSGAAAYSISLGS